MENKKSKVEDLAMLAKDGKIEIIHRTGAAEKLLDPVKPIEKCSLSLSGDIKTVFEFLNKRSHLFNPEKCHIKVEPDEFSIQFTGNEQWENNDFATDIYGRIEKTKDIIEFPFGKSFNNKELAQVLRARRNLFESQDQFKTVYQQLISFHAEISKRYENSDDRSGNMRRNIEQEVTHNMTNVFRLKLEVLKGAPAVLLEVELDIDPDTLDFTMYAFDLEPKIKELAKSMLEAELEKKIGDVEMKDWCFTYFV